MNFVFQLSLGQKFNQQKINSVIKKKSWGKIYLIWKITPKICSGPIFPIISYQRLFRHQIFSLGFPTQLFSDYFEIVLHWFFCPTYIIMILFANALCIFSQFSEKWRPIFETYIHFLTFFLWNWRYRGSSYNAQHYFFGSNRVDYFFQAVVPRAT